MKHLSLTITAFLVIGVLSTSAFAHKKHHTYHSHNHFSHYSHPYTAPSIQYFLLGHRKFTPVLVCGHHGCYRSYTKKRYHKRYDKKHHHKKYHRRHDAHKGHKHHHH